MFLTEISKTALTLKGWTIIGLLFLTVFVLNAFVLWLAMKMGEKKLLALE
jgi:hypothetical protein